MSFLFIMILLLLEIALIRSLHLPNAFYQDGGKAQLASKRLRVQRYTKGSEIFPPSSYGPFNLAGSFPNGYIPPIVQRVLNSTKALSIQKEYTSLDPTKESLNEYSPTETEIQIKTRKRQRLFKVTSRILMAAAKAQGNKVQDQVNNQERVSRLPLLIASILLGLRLAQPSDILFVVFLSGYLMFLNILSSSSKSDDKKVLPVMSSLPPQGHIPSLVSNPLGATLSESIAYKIWLQLGIFMGYVIPLISICYYYLYHKQRQFALLMSRTIFVLSCQISTESLSKSLFFPLPLRILIPLAYNSFRMGTLYNWVMQSTGWCRLLGIFNFFYFGANLFGFLIPIATMHYMRSHFFGVEAAEVVLRED